MNKRYIPILIRQNEKRTWLIQMTQPTTALAAAFWSFLKLVAYLIVDAVAFRITCLAIA